MAERADLLESPLLPIVPPRASAAEEAYNLLKKLIIRLDLPPGAVLSESFLIERLNLGRTPLREALQRLEQERLVVILPRRGILISDISISDLQAIFELRSDLEGLCGRLAAQRITPEQIAALEKLFDGAEAGTDPEDDVAVDQEFHRLVVEAAGNHLLTDTLSRLHDQSIRLLYLSKSRMAKVMEDFADYLQVIDALKRGDAEGAAAGLRKHADARYRRVRQTF